MEPLEEYHSPFDFEQGLNTNYLYLSPAYSTPPSSPSRTTGPQQPSETIPEVGEDAASAMEPGSGPAPPPPPPTLTPEERQALQEELLKVVDEIQTLTQVLAAKEKQLAEIKRKLGITHLNELKHNISKTWQDVTTSVAYKRTSETLSQAGMKASTAFTSMGSAITRKLEDVRNAPSFKSFEGKVDTLKTKMASSASSGTADQDSRSTTESLLDPPEDLPAQEAPMPPMP